MRSLFLLLLLLNILYALWQLQDGIADRALLTQADQPLERRLPGMQSGTEAGEQGLAPAAEPATPGTVLCVSLGSFPERARAEQLRQRMMALGIGSDLVVREVAGSLDFWLVLPVTGGRPVALAAAAGYGFSGSSRAGGKAWARASRASA